MLALSQDLTSSGATGFHECVLDYCSILKYVLVALAFVMTKLKMRKMSPACATSGCRWRRQIKCDARRRRRQRNCSSSSTKECCLAQWSCPFECAFLKLRMPPPLPFQAKRASRAKEGCCNDDEREDSSTPLIQETSFSMKDTGTALEDSFGSISSEPSTASSDEIPTLARPSREKRRRSSASLLDLARMQQWKIIEDMLPSQRRSARLVDADGLYPLHWACAGSPTLSVVKALVEAYPKAVMRADSEGSLPLHFACHYQASKDVVEYLIRQAPQACGRHDKYGRTPLYHAVSKQASLEVLEVLVSDTLYGVQAITKSCHGPDGSTADSLWQCHTPLYLAWTQVLRQGSRLVQSRKRLKLEEKALLLLRTALHHVVKIDGDVDLISMALRMHSLLPPPVVEYALRRGHIPPRNSLSEAARLVSPHLADDMIRLLLEHGAAEKEEDPSKPLYYATATGKTWHQGVERLWKAFPDSLSGSFERLPPAFASAAASVQRQEPATPAAESRDSWLPHHLQSHKAFAQASAVNMSHGESAVSEATSPDDAEHLSTIYQLLLAEPSILVNRA